MSKWQHFLCNVLGWHRITKISMAGINPVGYCVRCKRRCLKDSQGNWFDAPLPIVQRRPPAPEDLAGALHDVVHKDTGAVRAVRPVQVSGKQ